MCRHWVYLGFIAQKVASNLSFAMEAHKNALNVINWGRHVWKDVPSNERGTIFPSTTSFIRSSTLDRSGADTRTTSKAVVVSETPYRRIASVIWPLN